MNKNRKPRKNPNPQPNVATEQQFTQAMHYVVDHNATVQALYGARQDRSNQCFALVDVDNTNNRALLGTLTANDPDGVAAYVSTCRSQGIRPWILVLVPDAAVRTLTGIDATGLYRVLEAKTRYRAGLGCRPNLIPVVALSLPACQVFGYLPEVTEVRPQPTPSVN